MIDSDSMALIASQTLLNGVTDTQAAIGCLRVLFHWVRQHKLENQMLVIVGQPQLGFHAFRNTVYRRMRFRSANSGGKLDTWTRGLCNSVKLLIDRKERA